jgi:hypothetical protein
MRSRKPDETGQIRKEIHDQNLVKYSFESLIQQHSRSLLHTPRDLPESAEIETRHAASMRPSVAGAANDADAGVRTALEPAIPTGSIVRWIKTAMVLVSGAILGISAYIAVGAPDWKAAMEQGITRFGLHTEKPAYQRPLKMETGVPKPAAQQAHEAAAAAAPPVVDAAPEQAGNTAPSDCTGVISALHLCTPAQ